MARRVDTRSPDGLGASVTAKRTFRVAAIQLEAKLGDIAENLERTWRLGSAAGEAGAAWILLPEFFTSGMGFLPSIGSAISDTDGPAIALMQRLARRYDATVGGSFLCRDSDGEVRNAYFLVTSNGVIARHNKDLPTLWENCWYIGGDDSGVTKFAELTIGMAACAELGRTATVRRLRGVDLVVAGSYTWHAPRYIPRALGRGYLNRRYFSEISDWSPSFARLVGAPVVEATHCGALDCRDQIFPFRYRCPIGDGAKICSADGTLLALRKPEEGAGFIVAEVEAGARSPLEELPDGQWIKPLGVCGSMYFALQAMHGRRWYRRNVRGLLDRQS